MNFDDFLKVLSKINNIPLLAEQSQFKMAPSYRKNVLKSGKYDLQNAKKAGVMALFHPDENNITSFVLILRKTYKGVHSAQVSFPGGKIEPYDKSLIETAIRETHEEIGVPSQAIEVIKTLSHLYIPPSNYLVQPVLGVTKSKPDFIKQESEVESILQISLAKLLSDSSVVTNKVVNSSNKKVKVPAYKFNGHIVWGATAMILSEIKDMLKQLV